MRFRRAVLTGLLLAGAAFAGRKAVRVKKDPWRYAGEDHGVRFYFQPEKEGGIRIKVENRLDIRVDVLYRVMDTDWKKNFACSLAPRAADSTIRYQPLEAGVRYPYFDRVYLDRADAAAASEPVTASVTAPGRS